MTDAARSEMYAKLRTLNEEQLKSLYSHTLSLTMSRKTKDRILSMIDGTLASIYFNRACKQ